MLNLYWKIFFGFWLTGVLLGGGALLVNQQLRHDLPLELQGLSPAEIVNRTAFIVRRVPEDLDDWQVELADNDIHLYLQESAPGSLASQAPPAAIATIFAYLQNQPSYERSTFTRLVIGRQEVGHKGQPMNFVMDMPSLSLFQLRQLAEQLTVQLLLAISLSAIACFILARYLTRNLKELGSVSKLLAAGDLSARMQPRRRLFNDELTLLGEDFNHMAESLENSIENQRRLVRDISHELRSPLARLQIALELARQKTDVGELDRIELEAERLNDLIGQILAMPDHQTAKTSAVDLGKLLTGLISDNEIEARNKQVALHLQSHATTTLVVEGNETQLQSALENIIRNAIHYTDNNTEVLVELKEEDGCALISVSDQGPGVPEEDLQQIFEPFYRVDPARNRKTGGYGVGLAIVKRTVDNHGGKVSAANTGRGLLVTIELPLAAS